MARIDLASADSLPLHEHCSGAGIAPGKARAKRGLPYWLLLGAIAWRCCLKNIDWAENREFKRLPASISWQDQTDQVKNHFKMLKYREATGFCVGFMTLPSIHGGAQRITLKRLVNNIQTPRNWSCLPAP